MAKLTPEARKRAQQQAETTPQPGEANYFPDARRAAIPLSMVQPCCQRAGCNERATWVVIAVIRNCPLTSLEPVEARAPSPSSALCDKHRDELEREPDMMLTDAAWENITLEWLRKGRGIPQRELLSWEFDRIPTYEELSQKLGEERMSKLQIKTAQPMHEA